VGLRLLNNEIEIKIMKKYSIVTLFLFQTIIVTSQSVNYPTIAKDLPTLLAPSPSVAALMKYEEVPVNNYTGLPDISIPLYSSPSLSKDISLNIALKYHAGSTGVDEKASDVGLGWSLFAGGSITRTVRGLPDEIYDIQNHITGGGKIGVYHTNSTVKNPLTQILSFEQNDGIPTLADFETLNEFLWNTTERGMYDTEYDLWQFNFMGKSGRFTIRKNPVTNILEIADLNLDCNLKISNIYNPTTFQPTSFLIYDDLGNKYTFDVIEKTKSNSTTHVRHQSPQLDLISNFSEYIYFNSTFHLSKIESGNNKTLINIGYNNIENYYTEHILDHSTTYNIDRMGDLLDRLNWLHNYYVDSQIANIDPFCTQITTQRIMTAKKINQISVEGICKIDFNYSKGRLDSNYYANQNSYVFKGITVKTWPINNNNNNNNRNSKYVNLYQGYSTTIEKRMVLDSVSFGNFSNNLKETYKLEYKSKPSTYNGTLEKDKWGYFTMRPFWVIQQQYYREVNPEFSTIETLQKMSLPTGGSIIFDYEANQYSYIGNDLLADFSANIYNWTNDNKVVHFNALNTTPQEFFTITEEQDVTFMSVVNTYGQPYSNYIFSITRAGTTQPVGGLDSGVSNSDVSQVKLHLAPGTYKVNLTSMDLDFPITFRATITAYYKTLNNNNFKFLFGGGNRIKQIGYFTKDTVPKDYYETSYSTYIPAKQIEFRYTKFDDPIHSSGSLATGEPIFEFYFDRDYYFFASCTGGPCFMSDQQFFFKKVTETNNLKAIKTGGADVGYKNVMVKEPNNGRTEYTYTSPIDFPEETQLESTIFPYKSTSNLDYKRGNILIERVYTQGTNDKLISETIKDYDYEEILPKNTTYGVTCNYINKNLPYIWCVSGYSVFQALNNVLEFAIYPIYLSINCHGRIRIDPYNYINYFYLHAANGWAKLKSKTTKNYFYPTGTTTPNIVQTDETYDYNLINKKISKSTITNSFGEVMKTEYFYLPTVDTPNSKNNISTIERIETHKNNDLLSTSKIEYSTAFAGNVSYLPQTILTSKGTQTLESRLKYNAYDEYGHLLELQQENGTIVSYIWGYNKTQPIAKIENATYAQVEPHVANLQTISNGTNETGLITALNALRTALPNAMVTTYSYKPLVGISTITDPKGDTQTYHYDAFNRLQFVKDAQDNIVSENEYHYRTQN
jgi:hypothetical protein